MRIRTCAPYTVGVHRHPSFLEAPDPAVQAGARDAGLQGALGGRVAAQDHGTQDRIALLLGPGATCAEVKPVLHRLQPRLTVHYGLPYRVSSRRAPSR